MVWHEIYTVRLITDIRHWPIKPLCALNRLTPVKPKPSSLVDTRVIYCGDNLDQLARLPSGCIDLIYIDPPFNSNRNYEVFWGETRERRAFEDRHASTEAYIDFMRPRCVELHRVLKQTGSFYYHCDWHAGHYVKVMLDQIFGENQFQNEIVWRRHYSHNDPKKFGCVHDVLFYYVAGKKYCWNQQYVPHSASYIDGRIFPVAAMPTADKSQLDFMDRWYPIQVKQKDKAGRPDIDQFEAVLVRAERPKGYFVSFDFTSDALQEIRRFQQQTGKVIKPLKVSDMLDDDKLVYTLT